MPRLAALWFGLVALGAAAAALPGCASTDDGSIVETDDAGKDAPAEETATDEGTATGEESTGAPPAGPGDDAPRRSLLIFSPSPNQDDHERRYEPDYQPSWDAIAPAFDALNLHAADIIRRDDDYIRSIAARVGAKPILLELQSTAALLALGLPGTGPCRAELDVNAAATCGQMAADAWFFSGDSGLGLHRTRDLGLQVEYILLDSPFYAPYRQLGYFRDGEREHTGLAKIKALYFMDGFMNRLKRADRFGPSLKFMFLSHFKYEYVAGVPGFRNRHDNATCYNTCFTGRRWIDEDELVDFVLTNLPGRFEAVLFDASWSSFSVTESPWHRWTAMIDAVRAHGVKVGNIVHTDGSWGQTCGHNECWFGPGDGCGGEREWYVHTLSYLDAMFRGGGVIDRAPMDITMVGSWHRLPATAFRHRGTCEIPLEDILLCAGQVDGRPVTCPQH